MALTPDKVKLMAAHDGDKSPFFEYNKSRALSLISISMLRIVRTNPAQVEAV